MTEKRHIIMIVDDEPLNLKLLSGLLRDDYTLIAANSGKKALKIIHSGKIPDLILLDIMMPEIDGYEVCRALKDNEKTKDIPIIFISAMNEADDEEKGLSYGAVDYIRKPFVPSIVRARVNTHLRLSDSLSELKRLYKYALESNPLTGLPGNNAIMMRVNTALSNKEPVCVLYLDLDNFKAYNDKYGFAMGDKIILFTAELLSQQMETVSKSFLAHIGGDDFFALIPSDDYVNFVENFIREFDNQVKQFYSFEDIRKGKIVSINRSGEKQEFPIITISIACVDLKETSYTRYLEVNDACTALKKLAKQQGGSSYFSDRRR
ncbi:MAG TPA: response regulator [Thermotogota bacterium]|nr:response regulator [Thermotogota bacterium]HPJ89303.1 response regulator [Thermotogota bacterium]HPR95174.1 response regulator [Thermotogota bacterium]